MGGAGTGYLELEVPIYNINKGMSDELIAGSNQLRQYSEFVAKLRENQEVYDDFKRAVKETVAHCVANDILADFLKEMGGDIVSILSMEYDMEMAKKVYAEERIEKIAANMIEEGYPVDAISRITGISESEILKLKIELN